MSDTPATMADAVESDPAGLTLPPSLDSEDTSQPPKTPAGPATIAEIRAMKKARRASHRMTLNTELAQVVADAQKRLGELYRDLRLATITRQAIDPETADAEKVAELGEHIDSIDNQIKKATTELEEARTQEAQSAILWKFQAISKEALEDLIKEWPAQAKQQAEYRKQMREAGGDGMGRLQFNAYEFHPRLVAACCVEPQLPEEDAVEMWQKDPEWSKGELDALFAICWNLNDVAS